MKVCLFIPSARGGGAERVFITLANALSKSGYIVDLMFVSAVGDYIDEIDKSVNVIDLKSSRTLFSIYRAATVLKRNHYDFIISGLSHINIISSFICKLFNVDSRLIISQRNIIAVPPFLHGGAKVLFISFLMRLSYRWADRVVAVSEGVKNNLIHELFLDPKKIDVIYNPINTKQVSTLSFAKPSHPWINSDYKIILAAGSLTQQKDFSTLIDAFFIISKKIPSKLIILGEGKLRHSLESKIDSLNLNDSVDLHGFVKNPFSYMRHCDVFVLSSLWEGMPNVLIQGLLCAPVVVSTDCLSGPSEILCNGKYGRLVPVADKNALASSIYSSIFDPTFVNNSRALDFDTDKIISNWIHILT